MRLTGRYLTSRPSTALLPGGYQLNVMPGLVEVVPPWREDWTRQRRYDDREMPSDAASLASCSRSSGVRYTVAGVLFTTHSVPLCHTASLPASISRSGSASKSSNTSAIPA